MENMSILPSAEAHSQQCYIVLTLLRSLLRTDAQQLRVSEAATAAATEATSATAATAATTATAATDLDTW